jgi:hypothetical protein
VVAAGRGRVSALLLPFLLVQGTLFVAADPKSTYYGGILVSDAFGRRGQEAEERARQQRLARAAAELGRLGVRAVIADVELKYHARLAGVDLRVIQPFRPEWAADEAARFAILGRALDRHGARHALATDPDEAEFYRSHPAFEGEVYRDDAGDPPFILVAFDR